MLDMRKMGFGVEGGIREFVAKINGAQENIKYGVFLSSNTSYIPDLGNSAVQPDSSHIATVHSS